MNSFLLLGGETALNDFCIILTERLVNATWQGGLLLAIVWLLCHCCQSLTPQARCWIWRIAFVKFLAILLIGSVIHLPVIPSTKHQVTSRKSATTVDKTKLAFPLQFDGNSFTLSSEQELVTAMDAKPRSLEGVPLGSEEAEHSLASKSSSIPLTLPGIIAIAWLVGVTISLVAVCRQWRLARKLARQSSPLACAATRRLYKPLVAKYQVGPNQPVVTTTLRGTAPMLVGVWRPRILIPKSLLGTIGPKELRLVLAHELAHVARHDLLWNLLVVVVRVCFFFHPLVWIGQSRYALDQEMACDQLALRTTRSGIKDYGNLLLKCSSASGGATQTWATVGVISSFNSLKKRIIEMGKKKNNSLGAAIASLAAVALCMLLAMPVQLVAQQEGPEAAASVQPSKEHTPPATQEPQEKIPVKVGTSQREPEMRVFATGRDDDNQTRQSTQRSTSRATSSRPSVRATGRSVSDRYAPLRETAEQQSDRSNVSVSVSNNGVSESIKVEWNDDNYVDVEYSTNKSGKKVTRQHQLGDIKSLKKTDAEAHRFYKKHVTASSNRDAMTTRAQVGAENNLTDFGKLSRPVRVSPSTRSTGSSSGRYEQPPRMNSNSNSASSSSWGSSASGQNSLTGRNTVRSSGGSSRSNKKNGGKAHEAMLEHIRQMRNQAEDPQMREVWDRMLKQSQNGGK